MVRLSLLISARRSLINLYRQKTILVSDIYGQKGRFYFHNGLETMKLKFSSTIEIFHKNRNFRQNRDFYKKSKFLFKCEILFQNLNFRQKSKFW